MWGMESVLQTTDKRCWRGTAKNLSNTECYPVCLAMKLPAFFIGTNSVEVGRSNRRGLLQATETTLMFSGFSLHGNFNQPDICWKFNTEGHKQSRRFLECIDDNFLIKLVKDLTKGGTVLGHILTNEEELVRDKKAGALAALTMGCQSSRSWEKETRQIAISQPLDFRRTDFWPVYESPWKNAVRYSLKELLGCFLFSS